MSLPTPLPNTFRLSSFPKPGYGSRLSLPEVDDSYEAFFLRSSMNFPPEDFLAVQSVPRLQTDWFFPFPFWCLLVFGSLG